MSLDLLRRSAQFVFGLAQFRQGALDAGHGVNHTSHSRLALERRRPVLLGGSTALRVHMRRRSFRVIQGGKG